MELGIFAKTFSRDSLAEVLDAVTEYGLRHVQFNMACAGLSSLPPTISPAQAEDVRRECRRRSIRMAAVSGTFNMIHPDTTQRRQGLDRLRVLTAACHGMGTSVVTLCTGTRDPENMWRYHPDNGEPTAWADLCRSMELALTAAEEFQVTLAIEPEITNVVDSAAKARRLLDEMQSPWLKVAMDAANLFHPGEAHRMTEVMEYAFDLLGGDIVIAHAKDLESPGDVSFVAAGQGIVDYDTYLQLLERYEFNGALILHGLSEDQVPLSVTFLKQRLTARDD